MNGDFRNVKYEGRERAETTENVRLIFVETRQSRLSVSPDMGAFDPRILLTWDRDQEWNGGLASYPLANV